jgi:hypothetical protein
VAVTMPNKAPQPTVAFGKILDKYRPANQRQSAPLEAWREHPDKEKLWQALLVASQADHRDTPTALDFIGVVLSSTLSVRSLNDHNDRVLDQFEKLKRKIAAVVADADYPPDLWRDLERFEQPLRDLGRSAFDIRSRAGGRKDQDGSRDRKAFVHRMFHYLHATCGQHLPKHVATMVDIFFPGLEDTERQVRLWLPPTPPKRIV